MIFTSLEFLLGYLPLFLLGYYLMPRGARNVALTAASYVFYGWWRPDFVVLMLISTTVDYVCAKRATPAHARRGLWLSLSLATNLGLLAYFKYANLVVATIEAAIGGTLQWQDVVLPVGISFYTFQSMSYTIDVYRGEVKPARSFVDLACFVSMFPQLVAGPIVRYRDVATQLTDRSHSFAKLSAGAMLFQIGFAKKLLIADNVALIADPVFALPEPGLLAAWSGLLAYALQIYFDFSGYSDMAIGLALMIGFRLPVNFISPYTADSITDFWRRWHVSLSTWLRDYLYIPLGGNQKGARRTYANLMITMLLGGLWHGAAWTFVLWGGYQGTLLIAERALGRRPLYHRLPRPLRIACTFVLVLFGWAIFRADGPDGLGAICGGLIGAHGVGQLAPPTQFSTEAHFALCAGVAVAFFGPQARAMVAAARPTTILAVAALFVVALGQLAARDFTPFLYFQF